MNKLLNDLAEFIGVNIAELNSLLEQIGYDKKRLEGVLNEETKLKALKNELLLRSTADRLQVLKIKEAEIIKESINEELASEISNEIIEKITSQFSEHLKLNFNYNSHQSKLNVYIDKGSATNEEIANVVAKISKLYRLLGGNGLTFVNDEIETFILKNA